MNHHSLLHISLFEEGNYDYIIVPDAGAEKKLQKVSQLFDIPLIQASKIRDTKTGNIIRTEVYADWQELGNCKVLIIDDICDGGRTFLELAKVLKEKDVEEIELFITHGIFANGLDAMNVAGISKFYTLNNIFNLKDSRLIEL